MASKASARAIGGFPHELPFFNLEHEHEVRTMYPHVEVHENDIGFIQFHTKVSISNGFSLHLQP